MPVEERDLFAWLGLGFTISTGLVLAFFAILAYAVQRARYLRDIEPDLRVLNVEVTSVPFYVNCVIENNSEINRAENIVITVDINLPKLRIQRCGHASRTRKIARARVCARSTSSRRYGRDRLATPYRRP